jgi:hypothetical protein
VKDGQAKGDEREDFRPVETAYLKQLKVTHRARARAAMGWRSRFLKGLASSWGCMFALKSAGVSYNTFRAHERNDPEFAAQVREAEGQGAQLLHHVCWQRVMEGDFEPVYWQGQVVGQIRKFDTRLQIEFLRGYMPDKFKRPGTQVNIGTKGDVFVLTEEQRHELQRINREWLESTPPPAGDAPRKSQPQRSHCVIFQNPTSPRRPQRLTCTALFRFFALFRVAS